MFNQFKKVMALIIKQVDRQEKLISQNQTMSTNHKHFTNNHNAQKTKNAIQASKIQDQSLAGYDPLHRQLNRVSGQLVGVIKMYKEKRSSVEIVRQLLAIRSGLNNMAKKMLVTEFKKCFIGKNQAEIDQLLKEILR